MYSHLVSRDRQCRHRHTA